MLCEATKAKSQLCLAKGKRALMFSYRAVTMVIQILVLLRYFVLTSLDSSSSFCLLVLYIILTL